jgi:hypothetical protein
MGGSSRIKNRISSHSAGETTGRSMPVQNVQQPGLLLISW